MKILCIDPGTTNLAAAIFEEQFIDGELIVNLVWNKIYSPFRDFSSIIRSVNELLNDASNHKPILVAIEDQEPFGMQSVLKWNSLVQGVIMGSVSYGGLCGHRRLIVLRPSDYKRRFKLAKGNRDKNKKAALEFARRFLPDIKSDHVADCFILFLAVKEFYFQGDMYKRELKEERFV
jgi:hypothetical protein